MCVSMAMCTGLCLPQHPHGLTVGMRDMKHMEATVFMGVRGVMEVMEVMDALEGSVVEGEDPGVLKAV